jgi:hypothetical protein
MASIKQEQRILRSISLDSVAGQCLARKIKLDIFFFDYTETMINISFYFLHNNSNKENDFTN